MSQPMQESNLGRLAQWTAQLRKQVKAMLEELSAASKSAGLGSAKVRDERLAELGRQVRAWRAAVRPLIGTMRAARGRRRAETSAERAGVLKELSGRVRQVRHEAREALKRFDAALRKRLNRCAVDARRGNRVYRFVGPRVARRTAAVHGRRARAAVEAGHRGAWAADRVRAKVEKCRAGRQDRSKDDRRRGRQTRGGEETKIGGGSGGLRAEHPGHDAAAKDRLGRGSRLHRAAVKGSLVLQTSPI